MRQNVMSEQSKSWIYEPADAGQSVEVIHWEYYDFKTFAAGAMPSSISFFNTPSGTPVGNSVATKESSNIPKPLSVGSPYKFLIQEVALVVLPVGRAWADVATAVPSLRIETDIIELLSRGVANLKVLGVDRMEVAPLLALPSGIGLGGATSGVAASPMASGWPVLSNRYPVEIGLHKDTTFEMNITFPEGVITLANSLKVGIIFDGLLQRPKGK